VNILINSWAKYKEWIGNAVQGGAKYYFRGQRKSDWVLQTSFHRYSTKMNITMLDYLDRIIPEVGYYVSATENEYIDIGNEIQFGAFLAKLQHHGFPTPLLDWTLSPYIAAYFAFKDIDPHVPENGKVSISIFDINLWSQTYTQPLNLRDTTPFISSFRPLAKNNPRMIQQMAVSTATNVSDLSSYIVDSSTKTGKTFLYQVELPISERKLVMNELNLMGINSMTMFPDFDGICSSMKEIFFNNLDVMPLIPPPPKT